MLDKIIDIATDNLIKKSSLISTLHHPLEKGVFREFFISEILSPLLPHHYDISSGIIVDFKGKQSPQMDVIIYDKRKFPPLMLRAGAGIIPLDSVMCVIEVKSELTATDLRSSLHSATTLNPNYIDHLEMVKSSQASNYPLYAVFAYKSSAQLKEEDDRANQEYISEKIQNKFKTHSTTSAKPTGDQLLKLICILDKGVWSEAYAGEYTIPIRRRLSPTENMRNFVWLLLSQIEEIAHTRGSFDIKEWMQLS
jgi:hypothetical protein